MPLTRSKTKVETSNNTTTTTGSVYTALSNAGKSKRPRAQRPELHPSNLHSKTRRKLTKSGDYCSNSHSASNVVTASTTSLITSEAREKSATELVDIRLLKILCGFKLIQGSGENELSQGQDGDNTIEPFFGEDNEERFKKLLSSEEQSEYDAVLNFIYTLYSNNNEQGVQNYLLSSSLLRKLCDRKDDLGYAPLLRFVIKSNSEHFRNLVKYGANVFVKNRNYKNCWHCIMDEVDFTDERPENFVKILSEYRPDAFVRLMIADDHIIVGCGEHDTKIDNEQHAMSVIKGINDKDNKGYTPLHLAIQNYQYLSTSVGNKSPLFECLVKYGADIHVTNREGVSPINFQPKNSAFWTMLTNSNKLPENWQKLIDERVNNSDGVDCHGNTILHLAILQAARAPIAAVLTLVNDILAKINDSDILQQQNKQGLTPMNIVDILKPVYPRLAAVEKVLQNKLQQLARSASQITVVINDNEDESQDAEGDHRMKARR